MKEPTFLQGAGVALAASLAGSVLLAILGSVFPGASAVRLLIAGISLAYVLYLLSRSRERVGRVTVIAAWFLASGLVWLMAPSFTLYVIVHIGFIWLVRSLYFYSSVLAALADLGLTGLSLATATWALSHSGSVFLSIWCFFLIQAVFVAIPARLPAKKTASQCTAVPEDRFQRAFQAAENAVRKLSSVQ